MKNKTIIALAILLLTMPFSCSQSGKEEVKKKIIDVAASVGGGKIINISDIAKDIRYIPLETSAASLVGNIPRVFYENGALYIHDMTDTIKIFDTEGKLVRKFSRVGRGPEEYPLAFDFFVTPNSGKMLINTIDANNSIYKYDNEGRYIGKFITPSDGKYKTMWPIWLDDNTLVATIGRFLDKPDYSVVVYDSLGQIKLLVPMPKLAPYKTFSQDPFGPGDEIVTIGGINGKEKPKIRQIMNPDRTKLYRFGDKMRVIFESNDTVLSVGTNLQIDTPYIFNYGKYQNNSMDRSSINATKGGHISLGGKNQYMESEDFVFLQLFLRDFAHEPYEKAKSVGNGTYALTDSYAIFNKKTDAFSFLNQTEKGVLGFRENLMDGPPFWPTYISNDNSLVMVIPALTLIEYAETHTVSPKLAEIVKNMKDTDNPVVVIAK